MKYLFRNIIQTYLKYLTKLVLFIQRPFVVAVAGSANKYFFKEKINEILRSQGLSVRSNPKSFNTKIGLPLAILDLPSGYSVWRNWLPIIFRAPMAIFKKFPKILVLELGVSDHNEMKCLLSIIQPKIAVITDITQRYLEGFSDFDELAGEYELLAHRIEKDGLLILNYDNPKIREIGKNISAPKIFFSLEEKTPEDLGPDFFWQAQNIKRVERGESFTVKIGGNEQTLQTDRFGAHHIQALLASLIISEKIGIIGNHKND